MSDCIPISTLVGEELAANLGRDRLEACLPMLEVAFASYVSAIPPGESRSSSSYADLYRTEKNATVKISDVYFAK